MEPGRYYHIYNHANGSEVLFKEAENYRWFLKQYDTYISPVSETYAYCLLPNHFHFLVRIKDANTLRQTFPKFETLEKLENAAIVSRQFSNLFSSYAQGFNKVYKRKGSLFLKNFKRKLVDTDNYFSLLTAYIHLNPVIHGFTKYPDEWIWSSYKTILSNSSTRIERDLVVNWFGSRERFIEFHTQYHAQKFPDISLLDEWFRLK